MGERLKKCKVELLKQSLGDLTVREWAEDVLGVSVTTAQKLLDGKGVLSCIVRQVAKALRIPPRELLADDSLSTSLSTTPRRTLRPFRFTHTVEGASSSDDITAILSYLTADMLTALRSRGVSIHHNAPVISTASAGGDFETYQLLWVESHRDDGAAFAYCAAIPTVRYVTFVEAVASGSLRMAEVARYGLMLGWNLPGGYTTTILEAEYYGEWVTAAGAWPVKRIIRITPAFAPIVWWNLVATKRASHDPRDTPPLPLLCFDLQAAPVYSIPVTSALLESFKQCQHQGRVLNNVQMVAPIRLDTRPYSARSTGVVLPSINPFMDDTLDLLDKWGEVTWPNA